MQQQQQYGISTGPLGDKINLIVGLFKHCGGKSAEYTAAVAKLPAYEKPHVEAAVLRQIAAFQQQLQQLQM